MLAVIFCNISFVDWTTLAFNIKSEQLQSSLAVQLKLNYQSVKVISFQNVYLFLKE